MECWLSAFVVGEGCRESFDMRLRLIVEGTLRQLCGRTVLGDKVARLTVNASRDGSFPAVGGRTRT